LSKRLNEMRMLLMLHAWPFHQTPVTYDFTTVFQCARQLSQKEVKCPGVSLFSKIQYHRELKPWV